MYTCNSFTEHRIGKYARTFLAWVAAVGLALCVPQAGAQSGAGSIQGTVTDSTGAVIPSAAIHVVNQATNVATQARTNSVGFYQVPGLFTGDYTINISAPGMSTYTRTIELLVSQTAVINASLKAGAVSQQVVVTGNAIQLVTTDNGTITSTLENARINQLPMNGRNIIGLVQETTPGLTSCSQSSSCPNGLFGEAMEYVADGVSLTGREFGGSHTGGQMPDPDSVQEVHVDTIGSGAQYATPATAVMTTKSGTNQIHGSAFETARNNAFGIARQRQNPSTFVAPPYIRNEFGASAGGPIVVPGLYHGKDKSFWFFAYERYSLRGYSYEDMKVPTLAMRQGDFSGLLNSSNTLQVLYDPMTTQYIPKGSANGKYGAWTRQAYTDEYGEGAGNQTYCNGDINCIPSAFESPTAKIFNDIQPLPSNGNNPLVQSNLSGPKLGNNTVPTYTLRLDHVFNENNRAYIRYTNTNDSDIFNRDDPSAAAGSVAADGLPQWATGISLDYTDLFAGAIGYTHIFSPTFFSETVVSQNWFGEFNAAEGTPNANFEKQLGLPNNFGEPGFPYVESIISPMDGTQFQYGVTQIISEIDQNFTKTLGRHQLHFGGRYRHERFGETPDESKDTVNFNGNGTGLEDPTTNNKYSKTSNTGYADADEYIGNAASYGVNIEPPYQHLHDMEFDAYLQDDYHVTTNLTLNLGLRYEAHPAIWSKYGMMQSFDLKNDAMVLAATPDKLVAEGLTTQAVVTNDEYNGIKFETPAEAGMPANTLTNNSDFTFGPRVGFAWQLPARWGTVLRGAYGRYIYPEPIRSSVVFINRVTPFTAGYGQNFNSANQSPDGLTNFQLRAPQTTGAWDSTTLATPVMGKNSANAVNSSTTTSLLPGYSIYSVNPDDPPNYVQQTDFTIEQPLPANSVLRVSYLYTHGSNLDQNYLYNNHPSTYTWEVMTGTIPPAGTTVGLPNYSATGEGPYDQLTYGGGSYQFEKSGWSNDNILQANFQRLYHSGFAYQIEYNWQKPMRLGGNGGRDGNIYPISNYSNSGPGVVSPYVSTTGFGSFMPSIPAPAPPAAPGGLAVSSQTGLPYPFYRALNRYENYMEDTGIPLQKIQFNGIIDLPFGKGKRFLGGANRALNEAVGGWQLAGAGAVTSQNFTVTASHYGPTNPIHLYKHKHAITDCRSGNCYKAYLWFNGYLPPTSISGNVCSSGLTTVVSGLPSDYVPYSAPSDLGCSAPTVQKGKLTTNVDKYFGGDPVNITTTDGNTAETTYAPGPSISSTNVSLNPFSHTVLNGPMYWSADASLFKVFPVTERVNLRFNVDAFNVFNVQGLTNPDGGTGVEQVTPGGVGASSKNSPRQIQLTLRLNF